MPNLYLLSIQQLICLMFVDIICVKESRHCNVNYDGFTRIRMQIISNYVLSCIYSRILCLDLRKLSALPYSTKASAIQY